MSNCTKTLLVAAQIALLSASAVAQDEETYAPTITEEQCQMVNELPEPDRVLSDNHGNPALGSDFKMKTE